MDMDGGRPETGMNMDAGTSDMDMDMMMGGGMEMETMGFDMLMFPQPLDYGKLRLNRIGTIYLVVFCIWTTAFAIGWAVLIKYRKLPFIRLKNVPLVSWALAFLHLQLSFDILVYPLNGILPCRLEFWIMNICLPLGIALFQAQNMQLLSIFWGQRRFRDQYKHNNSPGSMNITEPPSNPLVTAWRWWRGLCYLKKTYTLVITGTVIQCVMAIVIFLISKRFNPSFGIVSKVTNEFECRVGWEWFPSGIWQAIWTYGFGPFILFKIRDIQDTHRWKLQTTLAILFSLPALPLWLSTWFIPNFYVFNEYWPPNLWFVPGLGMMEFIILFFPIYELYEYKTRHKRLSQTGTGAELKAIVASKYSAAALDGTLSEREDLEKLEEFAATKDFTAENIIFLRKVAVWRDKWILSESNAADGQIRPPVIRKFYDAAEQTFYQCVSRETSTFPLNLEDDVYLPLQRTFGGMSAHCPPSPPRSIGCATQPKALIAPFADDIIYPSYHNRRREGFKELGDYDEFSGENPEKWSMKAFYGTPGGTARGYSDECPPTPPRKDSIPGLHPPALLPIAKVLGRLDAEGPVGIRRGSGSTCSSGEIIPIIPPTFGSHVFDEAEAAVKQIVLTNTWIRYVDSLPPSEQLKIEERALVLLTASSTSPSSSSSSSPSSTSSPSSSTSPPSKPSPSSTSLPSSSSSHPDSSSREKPPGISNAATGGGGGGGGGQGGKAANVFRRGYEVV